MSRHPKPPNRQGPKAAAPAPAGGSKASAPRPAPPRPAREHPAALETFALAKEYGDLPALSPIDLAIEPGESVALVGHNGSGKTTLLRIAAGLLDATSGTVTISGHESGSLAARAALSFLPDNPTFYEDLSVWEHLEYVARLHSVVDWEQQAADLLGHLGLYHRADDLPVQFSRGLRQKASLAMGLIRPFALLLVDEPFVGLDAAGKLALLELLDQAHDEGATVVVATHELEFVSRVDRCVALRDGVVVHDGDVEGVDLLELVTSA